MTDLEPRQKIMEMRNMRARPNKKQLCCCQAHHNQGKLANLFSHPSRKGGCAASHSIQLFWGIRRPCTKVVEGGKLTDSLLPQLFRCAFLLLSNFHGTIGNFHGTMQGGTARQSCQRQMGTRQEQWDMLQSHMGCFAFEGNHSNSGLCAHLLH